MDYKKEQKRSEKEQKGTKWTTKEEEKEQNYYHYYYYQPNCKPQLIEQNAQNPKAPAGKAVPRRKKINRNEGKKDNNTI